jgi:hypothetical protein
MGHESAPEVPPQDEAVNSELLKQQFEIASLEDYIANHDNPDYEVEFYEAGKPDGRKVPVNQLGLTVETAREKIDALRASIFKLESGI